MSLAAFGALLERNGNSIRQDFLQTGILASLIHNLFAKPEERIYPQEFVPGMSEKFARARERLRMMTNEMNLKRLAKEQERPN